jgi:hypothetical protein
MRSNELTDLDDYRAEQRELQAKHDLKILKALSNGNHLSDMELNRAKSVLLNLQMALETRVN